MDKYQELTNFNSKNKPKIDQLVVLSKDLMGYGISCDGAQLDHNHGKIVRIVPKSERDDQYTVLGMYNLVDIELPDKSIIQAYDRDLTPLY